MNKLFGSIIVFTMLALSASAQMLPTPYTKDFINNTANAATGRSKLGVSEQSTNLPFANTNSPTLTNPTNNGTTTFQGPVKVGTNQITGNGGGITNLPLFTGNNVLTIDNENGNDALAAADPYHKPWRTAYDLYNTTPTTYGACTVAKAGDWIYFKPSSNAYYVAQIPLNLINPSSGGIGFNLYVPSGVTIIHTNYSNTNATPILTKLAITGPMVIPGNNSFIRIDGNLWATNYLNDTNEAAGWLDSDACIGWIATASSLATTGVTNYPGTNVTVDGVGTLNGSGDSIYCTSLNGIPMTITFKNVWVTDFSDGLFFVGNLGVLNTEKIHVISGNVVTNGTSHGIFFSSSNWIDHGSVFIGTGSAAQGSANGGGYLASGLIKLENTTFKALGVTNMVPLTNLISAVITGDYIKVDTNGVTTHISQTYAGYGISIATTTNQIVLSGFGGTGPSTVNFTYTLNTTSGSWTNTTNTRYLTNRTGTEWDVITAGTPRYFVLQSGSPVNAAWSITNSTASPAGASAYFTTTNADTSIRIVGGISGNADASSNSAPYFPYGIATALSNTVAPSSISFPATTVNWTNSFGFSIELYIDNTGVTGTALKKNAGTIGVLPLFYTMGLQNGEYFSETYTVGSPTAKWSPR